MTETYYKDVISNELLLGAIENNEMDGFREDFHVLHCLLSKHRPHKILEIGTYMGRGTNIICNASPASVVYTLDLSPENSHMSKQYPTREQIGILCERPFKQLLGDSMTFDYSSLSPLDAVFIDGEHDYEHVLYETIECTMAGAWLLIYHDADMEDVYNAVNDAFSYVSGYALRRVVDTRILYAVKI
jgi:predicted O-methyltransferase YrrM